MMEFEVLCGNLTWSVWNDATSDFGKCFEFLCLVAPAHLLLALASAFQIGKDSGTTRRERTTWQKRVLWLRTLLSLIMAMVAISSAITRRVLHVRTGSAGVLSVTAVAVSWILHSIYAGSLKKEGDESYRGVRKVIFAYVLCLIVDCISAKSDLILFKTQQILYSLAITMFVCHGLMLTTFLIPKTYTTDYIAFDNDGQWQEPVSDLGDAKQFSPFLSKVLIFWANPLIKKGREGRLQVPSDVFGLPKALKTMRLSRSFQGELRLSFNPDVQESTNTSYSLLKTFFSSFGPQFFAIGLLKLFADLCGFASPLLLSQIITFMESEDANISWGYYYALALSLTSLIVALCNTHFNLFMSELGLKVRASVVSAVYDHTVDASSQELSKFKVGEVINFMSTDIDRICNFCPSIHAAWSLPVQFAVTLALLYVQVGVSALVGVVVTILLIPVNKVIANSIGALSTKMMSAKDDRVSLMTELLQGIRVVRFFVWENFFTAKVNGCREKELKYLKRRKYLDAVCVYLWATTPVVISVLTFTVYVFLGNELTAAKVFTSLALFSMLTGPLNAFPWVLNGLVEAKVSIQRVSAYLALPRFKREAVFAPLKPDHDGLDLVLTNSNHQYQSPDDESDAFSLKDINLRVEKGQFLGIVGPVGSGKTTLLRAVLGELITTRGDIEVHDPDGGVAYVQQEPWLQQKSVRDNILFGSQFDATWYEQVIDACCLKKDLTQLSQGDLTNVGERGSMLSGGQKARVALARAVYQKKEVVIIDDIFSAVDTIVGNHIYSKCIMGLLARQTRLVCTHHSRYLAGATKVIVMKDGEIIDSGPPIALLPKYREHTPDTKNEDPNEFESEQASEPQEDQVEDPGETQERGRVKFGIYKSYWIAVGVFLSPAILLSLILMQATRNATDVWLAHWVSDTSSNDTIILLNSSLDSNSKARYYLTVYGSLGVANSIFTLIRAFLFAYGGVCAAKKVQVLLLNTIMNAKTYFFDSTPLGRIINRFSSDLYTVDDSLPFILNIFLASAFGLLGTIVVCAYSVPWIALVLVPLTFVYFDVQKKYRPASRDLKRISSVSLSPIYAHFTETLNGLSTIRAMKETERFKLENLANLDANQRAQYSSIAAAQWLDMRLQLIGCAVVTGIACIAMLEHHFDSINPGFVGLAISYALGITGKLSQLVSAFTETEKELVAVERCYEYIKQVPQEEDRLFLRSRTRPLTDWPRTGRVRFRNVHLRYRDHLPLALQGLEFSINHREKVGIVGRTGAGKSSVFQALFHMVELTSGDIFVDERRVRDVERKVIRKNLAIIPQEPILFSGSIRDNLDPLQERDDYQLWASLRDCRLETIVQHLGGLDGELPERGKHLSVGQRQLFCLARALLSESKIICVDEATANIDLESDQVIQDVIRSKFRDKTVITIAHRIETVLNCDKIIVMDRGKAVEIGNPKELLELPNSTFRGLMNGDV